MPESDGSLWPSITGCRPAYLTGRSPFVATFFAVEDAAHKNYDAAIYALNPMRLNECQAADNIIFGDQSGTVAPLFKAGFRPAVDCPGIVVGVGGTEHDVRQMMQQAAFTIHGIEMPINSLPEAASFLRTVRIPRESKESLLHAITLLGVHWSSLFPGLQNLAEELKGITFTLPI